MFDGEKYVGLNYKYILIDQDYKLLVLNKVLCNVEYQSNGSSNSMWRQYLNNPRGFAFLRKFYMKYNTSNLRNYIDSTHYVSSSILSRNCYFIRESPKKILTVLSIPFGIILFLITLKKGRKTSNE